MSKKKERIALPKLSYDGPYKKALDICQFYGFSLIEPPEITKDTLQYIEKFEDESEEKSKEPSLNLSEKAAMIRTYADTGLDTLPQPVLLMYTRKPNARGERYLHLHVVGVTKCVADMLSIHLSLTILEEILKKEFVVHINSMGDKESSSQFVLDLTSFYRKRINLLSDDSRESFKQNILNVLTKDFDDAQEFQEEAPKPITFLSDTSRKHFKEIIELLETKNMPYVIDHSLVGHKDAYSETLFSIKERTKSGAPGSVFACGSRSDTLTRGAGMRKAIPIVSTTILIPGATNRETIKQSSTKNKKPLIYFIQLGDEARLRSFTLLEKLRKARLPVAISIGKEQMSAQIAQADRLKVPITLIMGQKEALDNTVILRNMQTHSQETVEINEIIEKIHTLIK